jgi:hypothetical protein
MDVLRSTVITNALLLTIAVALFAIAAELYVQLTPIRYIANNLPEIPQPCGRDDSTPCHVYIVPH